MKKTDYRSSLKTTEEKNLEVQRLRKEMEDLRFLYELDFNHENDSGGTNGGRGGGEVITKHSDFFKISPNMETMRSEEDNYDDEEDSNMDHSKNESGRTNTTKNVSQWSRTMPEKSNPSSKK